MSIGTSEEYEALLRAGRVLARVMRAMADRLRPGVSTGELDELAEKMLLHNGARSAPRLCEQRALYSEGSRARALGLQYRWRLGRRGELNSG